MARAFPLSSQTTHHFVVIRKNRAYPLEHIKKWLNDNMSHWALIVHENDEDPKDHSIIIPIHYHFVGIAKKNRTPLSTWLNSLAKHLKTDTNGIEYDGYKYFEKALQYLIHKNNKEKTQHKISEIYFSGWTQEEINTYMSCEDNSINFDRVLGLCRQYNNIVEVIRELGLSNYHRYRATIQDIFFITKKQQREEEIIKQQQAISCCDGEYLKR